MKVLYSIAFLFTTYLSCAQGGEVELIIEPRTAEVGEVVIVTVKSKVTGDVEIENLTENSFVHGNSISVQSFSEIDPATGHIVTFHTYSQSGTFTAEGEYTIGPAYVISGNKSYPSNSVSVSIVDKTRMMPGEVTSDQLSDPAFGVVQTNKKTIYEGEPLLISAKVYSHFEPSDLKRYHTYSMDGTIDRYSISGSKVLNPGWEVFKGTDLHAFEYDRTVAFPIGVGNFKISSFTLHLYRGYQYVPITSTTANITIKPLPKDPPADFIGAVGDFSISREIDVEDLKQGDVFEMAIIVSGAGNLHNITEPKPTLPKGFLIYGDPQVEEKFSFSARGAEGQIKYIYNVQVSKYGDLTLPPATISYFDVDKQEYVTASSVEHQLAVERNKNFVVEEVQEVDDSHLEVLNVLGDLRQSKLHERNDELIGSPVFWLGVGAPIMTAFLFLFVVKRRERSEEAITVKQTIRKKDFELSDLQAQLKVKLAAGDHEAYYALIEATLKKAFELDMHLDDDRILNTNDILQHLDATNRVALKPIVQDIQSKCDQFRFGLSGDPASNEALLEQLNQLLNQLKT